MFLITLRIHNYTDEDAIEGSGSEEASKSSSEMSDQAMADSDYVPEDDDPISDPYPEPGKKQEIINYWKNQTFKPRRINSVKHRYKMVTSVGQLSRWEHQLGSRMYKITSDDVQMLVLFVFSLRHRVEL